MAKTKNALPLTAKEISQAKHLAALGFSMRHIGREMKRSPHAIARVLRTPDAVKEVADEKLKLADIFERLTHQTLESITMSDIEKATFLQRVTGAAIMVDKTQLLRNQPTAILDVRVLLDVAGMLRRRDDEKDEEDQRKWQAQHTLTVPPVPQTEQPASPVPKSAAVSHAPIRQTQTQSQPTPETTVRVRYQGAKEIPVDSADYDPLMHGFPSR